VSAAATTTTETVADRGTDPFLKVDDLRVQFPTEDGVVSAVDGVSFSVQKGKTLAIVGESGSGKSVTSQAIMGLINRKSATMTGEVRLDGEELVSARPEQVRSLRGKRMAMIFQDPLSSLHPFYSIGKQLSEAIRVHQDVSKSAALKQSMEMLARVGIPNPERRVQDYPHNLSGGMRQRVMIAMALLNDPELLIADEPTTALDVTVQAQIMRLLEDLQGETGMGLILITHDLGVVNEVADRVAVMYAGKIVETGVIDEVFTRPAHPYTEGLMASIPQAEAKKGRLRPIRGVPPNLAAIPSGCSFHPRCPRARTGAVAEPGRDCVTDVPALREAAAGRRAACHYSEEVLGG